MSKFCTKCGKEIKEKADFCLNCGKKLETEIQKNKLPVWLIIVIVIFVLIIIAAIFSDGDNSKDKIIGKQTVTVIDFSNMEFNDVANWCEQNKVKCYKKTEYSDEIEKDKFISQNIKNGYIIDEGKAINITYSLGKEPSATIIDFSSMEFDDISNWCEQNKVKCYKKTQYSNEIKKDSFISQSVKSGDIVNEGKSINITYSLGKEPSREYKNALAKAESYAKNLHMSKKGIYNQLISEYGEDFSKDAAQYAIDNIVFDWKANALEKAKSYSENLHMSKKGIYNQLISEYGENFTKAEVQYAIDNLDN